MVIRYWFGGVLMVVGAGLLADQLYPAFEFGLWLAKLWPLAILILGLIVLLTRTSTWMGGMIILILGGFLQLVALGIMGENAWGLFFPALLILIGVLVIFRLGRPVVSSAKSGDMLDHFIIFSGMDARPRIDKFPRRIGDSGFRGGEYRPAGIKIGAGRRTVGD